MHGTAPPPLCYHVMVMPHDHQPKPFPASFQLPPCAGHTPVHISTWTRFDPTLSLSSGADRTDKSVLGVKTESPVSVSPEKEELKTGWKNPVTPVTCRILTSTHIFFYIRFTGFLNTAGCLMTSYIFSQNFEVEVESLDSTWRDLIATPHYTVIFTIFTNIYNIYYILLYLLIFTL